MNVLLINLDNHIYDNSNVLFNYLRKQNVHENYTIKSEVIIVTGIDIKLNKENKKFLKHHNALKIAIGLNINDKSIKYFNHVFIHNADNVLKIQKMIGSENAHYIPDLLFKYNINWNIKKSKNKSICVFLNEKLAFDKIFLNFINKLSEKYKIIYYNDNDIKNFKQKLIKKYDNIPKFKYAICSDYRSSIFCINLKIPFLYIHDDNSEYLMKDMELSSYEVYNIKNILSNFDNLRKYRKDIINILNNYINKNLFILNNTKINTIIDNSNGIVINTNYNPETIANLISLKILGYPESKFNWGIADNLNKGNQKISDVIKFLNKEGEKLVLPKLKKFSLPIFVDLKEYQIYKTAHRGGWYKICEKLYRLNSVNSNNKFNGIIFDMYLDRTFHWERDYMLKINKIPYTSPWMGVIHHTMVHNYNTSELLKNKEFLQSLPMCKALFTLSEYLSSQIREIIVLINPNIKVFTLTHPIDNCKNKFLLKSYKENKDKKLINIGNWMRRKLSIYLVKEPKFIKKCILKNNYGSFEIPDDLEFINTSMIITNIYDKINTNINYNNRIVKRISSNSISNNLNNTNNKLIIVNGSELLINNNYLFIGDKSINLVQKENIVLNIDNVYLIINSKIKVVDFKNKFDFMNLNFSTNITKLYNNVINIKKFTEATENIIVNISKHSIMYLNLYNNTCDIIINSNQPNNDDNNILINNCQGNLNIENMDSGFLTIQNSTGNLNLDGHDLSVYIQNSIGNQTDSGNNNSINVVNDNGQTNILGNTNTLTNVDSGGSSNILGNNDLHIVYDTSGTSGTSGTSVFSGPSGPSGPSGTSELASSYYNKSIITKEYHEFLEKENVPHIYNKENDTIVNIEHKKYSNNHINKIKNSVTFLEHKTNEDYDDMLSKNIVFLDLIDCSAVNTVLECINRNTPIVINKIPGTIDLLGKDYPLFYNTLYEVKDLLNYNKIKEAHFYLKKMDKTKYTYKSFIKNIKNIINKLK